MRTFVHAVLASGLIAVVGQARGDQQADALKIIERAIKATGDETKQKNLQAETYKMKGTYHGMGAEIPYTGEMAVQLPNKSRLTFEFDAGGNKFAITIVSNGDKGWMKVGDQVMEMDADRLAENKENMHLQRAERLVNLRAKDFALAPLGESKIDEQAVIGVRVSHKGRRDINLYFDKETGLLVKSEMRVKDEAGQEINQENFYKDYKMADGLKYPSKVTVKRDGTLYIEGELTDWKPVEKLDDKLFEQPQ
jgi:outer membrane lipoprotein-sorting protein